MLISKARYSGPERTFSDQQAYLWRAPQATKCPTTAYQYRQLPVVAHRFLAERDLSRLPPWAAIWMCQVLRNP
jgi:hypothetical protein